MKSWLNCSGAKAPNIGAICAASSDETSTTQAPTWNRGVVTELKTGCLRSKRIRSQNDCVSFGPRRPPHHDLVRLTRPTIRIGISSTASTWAAMRMPKVIAAALWTARSARR